MNELLDRASALLEPVWRRPLGYSEHNVVDEVSTRRRGACRAHLRRYFHRALPTASVAQGMLDLIAQL
jgi:hypothetical protein